MSKSLCLNIRYQKLFESYIGPALNSMRTPKLQRWTQWHVIYLPRTRHGQARGAEEWGRRGLASVLLSNKGLETCNLLFNEYEATAQLQTDTLHRNLWVPSGGNGSGMGIRMGMGMGIQGGGEGGSTMVNSWLGLPLPLTALLGNWGHAHILRHTLPHGWVIKPCLRLSLATTHFHWRNICSRLLPFKIWLFRRDLETFQICCHWHCLAKELEEWLHCEKYCGSTVERYLTWPKCISTNVHIEDES